MLNVIMLNVIMLNVIMLNVILFKVVMLSAVAPINGLTCYTVLPNKSRLQNTTAHSRHQCMKTMVSSCHRCLINTGVEKNEQHFDID